MSTRPNVTLWYEMFRENLAARNHADVMYARQKSDISRTVIYYGKVQLEKSLAVWLHSLGGLAAEW